MIDEKLLESYSQLSSLRDDERRFYSEAWHLMDSIREEISAAFRGEIESMKVQNHYGRLGVECTLRSRPLEQSLFFGVYYDTYDHRIEFKERFQPEFALFFDCDPKSRKQLADLGGAIAAVGDLKNLGFEFNFPEDRCGNPWRVCYWRDPMRRYVNADLSDLRSMFEKRLQMIFESTFFATAKSIHPIGD